MGAWSFVAPRLRELAPGLPLAYVGRPENPSPATGSARIFQAEQERVVAEALAERAGRRAGPDQSLTVSTVERRPTAWART